MLLTTPMALPAAGLSPLYLPSGGQGDPTPHDPSLLFQKIRQGALWGFTAIKERKAKANKQSAVLRCVPMPQVVPYSFKGVFASWSLFSFFAHGLKMIPQKVMEQPLVTPGTTVEGAEGVPLPPGSAAVRFAFS